jgi:hypothetical protein
MNTSDLTPEEKEIQLLIFNIRATGRNKMDADQLTRISELMTWLVGRGLETFDKIFDSVWKLRHEGFGRTEENTRLRVYEFVQRACVMGLIHKKERRYYAGREAAV